MKVFRKIDYETGFKIILLDQATDLLKKFGAKDDMPKSKKHLNYEKLNLKSKRILNRLYNHIVTNKITI